MKEYTDFQQELKDTDVPPNDDGWVETNDVKYENDKCCESGTAHGWTDKSYGHCVSNVGSKTNNPYLCGIVTWKVAVGQLPPNAAESLVQKTKADNQQVIDKLLAANYECVFLPVHYGDSSMEFMRL